MGGRSFPAVRLYQKNYARGTPDYVTVVDLRYATILNLTGTVTHAPCGTLSHKNFGPGPGSFWADATAMDTSTRTAHVLVNGTFFSNAPSAPVAFGLKTGGSIVSYGYAATDSPCVNVPEYPGSIRTIGIDSAGGTASIQDYSKDTFDGGWPDVIGGLDPTCCKQPTTYRPRNLMGLLDEDGDGRLETMLIFSSTNATLSGIPAYIGADAVLSAFGAAERIQFDGGSSTGLIVDGTAQIQPSYTLPHAVAVFAGK